MYDGMLIALLVFFVACMVGGIYYGWMVEFARRENEKRWGDWKKEIGSWYEEEDEQPLIQNTHCPACNTRYQTGEFVWLSTNPAVTRRRCLHCEPKEVS